MKPFVASLALAVIICLGAGGPASGQANTTDKPTWWSKYTYLIANGPDTCTGQASLKAGANVNVSNECGPQSETYVTVNPSQPKVLAAGSNEIFRLPMRGYFSSDNGAWRSSRDNRGALDLAASKLNW